MVYMAWGCEGATAAKMSGVLGQRCSVALGHQHAAGGLGKVWEAVWDCVGKCGPLPSLVAQHLLPEGIKVLLDLAT